MRWPLRPLQPLQKTQLQPPFGPSVDSLRHPWFTTTNLSYRFPIFETSATALRGTTGIQHYSTIFVCSDLCRQSHFNWSLSSWTGPRRVFWRTGGLQSPVKFGLETCLNQLQFKVRKTEADWINFCWGPLAGINAYKDLQTKIRSAERRKLLGWTDAGSKAGSNHGVTCMVQDAQVLSAEMKQQTRNNPLPKYQPTRDSRNCSPLHVGKDICHGFWSPLPNQTLSSPAPDTSWYIMRHYISSHQLWSLLASPCCPVLLGLLGQGYGGYVTALCAASESISRRRECVGCYRGIHLEGRFFCFCFGSGSCSIETYWNTIGSTWVQETMSIFQMKYGLSAAQEFAVQYPSIFLGSCSWDWSQAPQILIQSFAVPVLYRNKHPTAWRPHSTGAQVLLAGSLLRTYPAEDLNSVKDELKTFLSTLAGNLLNTWRRLEHATCEIL